jgi:glyoxylase-like metal-dependent hydrolase (beta-lactamase superfamily II)
MLSDHELPLPFSPDDLPAYLAALDRLAPFVAMAEYLIPGHGTPTDAPSARLDADRRYLDDVVRTGRSDDPRIGNPDMAAEYAHLQHLVREQNP